MNKPLFSPAALHRRTLLQPRLKAARLDGFLCIALPNVTYLTGFTGSNGAVLLTAERSILFTDPRYETQASQQSDCQVVISKGPLFKEVSRWIGRLKLRKLGFEANRIGFGDHLRLKQSLQKVRLVGVEDAVEDLRMVKSAEEIATIRASVQLNSAAFEQTIAHFKPMMSEGDLAAEIDYRMRLLGAEGTAFDTIVASGPRTALPHASPTENPIKPNHLLLIDMGARVAGYASDMTRTQAVGKLNSKIRRMYKAVLESQLAAIDAIRPGISCASVDRSARDVLSGYGLEKLFVHSTGHGLGLEIHERPRVGRKEPVKLTPGMVITIEPGVYGEGLGGIRIEDTVVVNDYGCEILTPTGKELIVL